MSTELPNPLDKITKDLDSLDFKLRRESEEIREIVNRLLTNHTCASLD